MKASTTVSGAANAMAIRPASVGRARHQAASMSSAKSAKPYVDHADIRESSQPGARWARSVTRV